MSIVIAVEGLTKTFPPLSGLGAFFRPKRSEGIQALRGISLEVSRGESVGLLGPNGGGKTTLLEILATYLLPTSGRVWLNGRDVVQDALAVRQLVGYCPAGAGGFYQRLSGRRNLEFFALLSRIPRAHIPARAARLWRLVGLDGFRDGPVAHYSDGMRQRLALARALLTDPPVLLLDEPTRGLDPEAAAFWRRFLRQQVIRDQGKTILLVTHNVLDAEEICDRVAIMDRGRIVAMGRADEVLNGVRSCSPAYALAEGAERP